MCLLSLSFCLCLMSNCAVSHDAVGLLFFNCPAEYLASISAYQSSAPLLISILSTPISLMIWLSSEFFSVSHGPYPPTVTLPSYCTISTPFLKSRNIRSYSNHISTLHFTHCCWFTFPPNLSLLSPLPLLIGWWID